MDRTIDEDINNELKQIQKSAEKLEKIETKDEAKKTGVGRKMKTFFDDISEKGDTINGVFESGHKALNTLKDLSAKYNIIAENTGLPLIPPLLLKNL